MRLCPAAKPQRPERPESSYKHTPKCIMELIGVTYVAPPGLHGVGKGAFGVGKGSFPVQHNPLYCNNIYSI